MPDQYGITSEDYVDDMKILSNTYCIQGMPFLIVSFSKQRLKPLQGIITTLMLYDFIYHIPEQVRRSTHKQ